MQVATSLETRTQFISKIKNLKEIITVEENKIKWLKSNAAAQEWTQKKKWQILENESLVELYNMSGRPSFIMNNPNLLANMHNSVEFEVADDCDYHHL